MRWATASPSIMNPCRRAKRATAAPRYSFKGEERSAKGGRNGPVDHFERRTPRAWASGRPARRQPRPRAPGGDSSPASSVQMFQSLVDFFAGGIDGLDAILAADLH